MSNLFDLSDEIYFGPWVVLKVKLRDGTTQLIDGPAMLIGAALLTPQPEWASAKIILTTGGAGMMEWIRSV